MNQYAQGLASLGRGPDSMLVHMSPREVAGLQTLAMKHGGSLTINPHTGLPEAGFLDSILPVVAGVGLAAATGGTSLALEPWMIGLGVGALKGLTSGSLLQGVTAGLGAYGGAGLTNTIAGMGSKELLEQAASQGSDVARQQLASIPVPAESAVSTPQTPPILGSGPNYGNLVPDRALAEAYAGMPSSSLAQAQPGAFNPSFGEQSAAYTPDGIREIFPNMTPTQQNLYADMKRAGYSPEDMATVLGRQGGMEAATPTTMDRFGAGIGRVRAEPMQFVKGNYKDISAAAAPLVSYGLGELATPPALKNVPTRTAGVGSIRPQLYSQGVPNPLYGQPGQPPLIGQGFTAQPIYRAAEGGMVPGNLNNRYPQSNINQSAYATASQSPMSQSVVSGGYESKINPFTGEMQMAGGGIADVYAAGGRLLRGDGDGVSDSIPAEIHSRHGVQKAALADGEFVLPARIVSEIGNGSTEAGARKLYAMMDRIQKHRGRTLKNVAKDTKAERLLPA